MLHTRKKKAGITKALTMAGRKKYIQGHVLNRVSTKSLSQFIGTE